MAGSGRFVRGSVFRGTGVTVSAALCLTLSPPLAAPAAAAGPTDITIPATMRNAPASTYIESAGPSGYLHTSSSTPPGLDWTDNDGTTRRVPGSNGQGTSSHEFHGAASDIVVLPTPSRTGNIPLVNMATGESWHVTVPAGQTYARAIGDTLVTHAGRLDDGSWTEIHLLRRENGVTVDRPVSGVPAGYAFRFYGQGGIHGVMYFALVSDGSSSKTVWIDVKSGEATVLPAAAANPAHTTVTARHVVTQDGNTVRIYEQGKFDTPVHVMAIDMTGARVASVVGDSLIIGRHDPALGKPDLSAPNWRLLAAPFDGSPERLLLARARVDRLRLRPDGGAMVVGGASALDYGHNAITAQENGTPVVRPLRRVPPVPLRVASLTIDRGTVTTLEAGNARTEAFQRSLTGTAPGFGPRIARGMPSDTRCGLDQNCPQLYPAGDGRLVYTARVYEGDSWRPKLFVLNKDGQFPGTVWETGFVDAERVQIVGVSGSLALATGRTHSDASEIHLFDLDTGKVLRRAPFSAGALWGTTMWTAGISTDGAASAVATHARTGAVLATVKPGSGCQEISELQAVGQWLYWRCRTITSGEASGIHNVSERRNVPFSDYRKAQLGNGVIVTGTGGGALDTYDLRSGAAVRESVADSHVRYSLDARTGDLAYSIANGDVRVLRDTHTDVPLSSPYRAVGTAVETDSTPIAWKGEWWLSEPAADWQITIRNRTTGRLVHAQSGGRSEYSIATTWNGRATDGGYLPNGQYTWTLTAHPADNQGAALTTTGVLNLTGGTAVHRDHNGDGIGDLLSLSSAGALAFRHGNGSGALSGATTGHGWPTSAVAVPFGDMNGDRCSDTLVRLGAELRAYRPACGKPLTPTTPYTSLGTVWAQFNILTAPGDLTGDGRPDLVARQATTGDMYLYADDGAGKLKARGRIGTNWKLYRAVFGAGDLDGDGRGDLLAVDATNSLWRYDGTAVGNVESRKLVFGNKWATGRNAFVGAGDLNQDGKADLISRNAAGALLRNNGSGTGSFGSTTNIGSGWQGYKALS
ncbi:FG-GAP-like repeat-containing protein [Streptomyces sp. NPDC058685]|uniref:FG-GAP-like repeat-containing protein n=1 Tax=Streptomyces sp. NPDC058685 TaxID=3346598 RepID=UPI00365B8F94